MHRLTILLVLGLCYGGCAHGLEGVGAGATPVADAARCAAITSGNGQSLHVHSAGHFLLLSSADDAAAAATGRFLDEVYNRFYESFGSAGFATRPVPDKLVCVCFNSYDQLDAYGHSADGVSASWMDGYYSYHTNRIAIVRAGYDARSRTASTPVRNAPVYGSPADSSGAGCGLNIRTVTHELAHQLAFNSGLQKREVTYPFWLTEGLATNFEADSSGVFGMVAKQSVHGPRLADAAARSRLIPIEKFVGMTELSSSQSQATSDAYAQAWGLFHYLFQHRRAELRQYMAELANAWPAQDSQSLRRRFVNVFGPIETLERDFLQSIGRSATGGMR